MKIFSPFLALFLAGTALAAPAKKPLSFQHLALGNVVRVISARFRVPVTITAHAASPITGDFSGLSLRDGLDEVAAQAGLEVVALGKTDAAGFLLRLPKAAPPSPAPVESAAERRAALLKRRADLQRSEADLKASRGPMNIQLVKDVVLVQLNAVELRQVLDERSMIHAVWTQLQEDVDAADRRQRWALPAAPLKICHEERGRGHVLHCRLSLWRYFHAVEAVNPLEREIRAHMLSLGLSGEADRRTGRYSPPPDRHMGGR